MDQPPNPPDPQPPAPRETAPPAPPAAARPSPMLLALGFVLIAVLGALLFTILLQPSQEAKKKDLESAREMLNRERLAAGLSPLSSSGSAESAGEIAERLKVDAATLASLAGSLQQLLAQKDSEITAAKSETLAAMAEQKRLRDQKERIRDDLDRALDDAALANTFKNDLDRARALNDSLREELETLRAEPGELRRQLAECRDNSAVLEARVLELQNQLAESRLFAGTESEIVAEATELFRSLRQLEDKSDAEISAAYSRFGSRLGAEALTKCSFATGSADLDPDLESEVRGLPSEVPDGALMFVVGYASETGDVDKNRALSSDRATAVAEVLNEAKRPGQRVQAAYLGQTDRFGSRYPERNQIVEIWQVVAQSKSDPAPDPPEPSSPEPPAESGVPPLAPIPEAIR